MKNEKFIWISGICLLSTIGLSCCFPTGEVTPNIKNSDIEKSAHEINNTNIDVPLQSIDPSSLHEPSNGKKSQIIDAWLDDEFVTPPPDKKIIGYIVEENECAGALALLSPNCTSAQAEEIVKKYAEGDEIEPEVSTTQAEVNNKQNLETVIKSNDNIETTTEYVNKETENFNPDLDINFNTDFLSKIINEKEVNEMAKENHTLSGELNINSDSLNLGLDKINITSDGNDNEEINIQTTTIAPIQIMKSQEINMRSRILNSESSIESEEKIDAELPPAFSSQPFADVKHPEANPLPSFPDPSKLNSMVEGLSPALSENLIHEALHPTVIPSPQVTSSADIKTDPSTTETPSHVPETLNVHETKVETNDDSLSLVNQYTTETVTIPTTQLVVEITTHEPEFENTSELSIVPLLTTTISPIIDTQISEDEIIAAKIPEPIVVENLQLGIAPEFSTPVVEPKIQEPVENITASDFLNDRKLIFEKMRDSYLEKLATLKQALGKEETPLSNDKSRSSNNHPHMNIETTTETHVEQIFTTESSILPEISREISNNRPLTENIQISQPEEEITVTTEFPRNLVNNRILTPHTYEMSEQSRKNNNNNNNNIILTTETPDYRKMQSILPPINIEDTEKLNVFTNNNRMNIPDSIKSSIENISEDRTKNNNNVKPDINKSGEDSSQSRSTLITNFREYLSKHKLPTVSNDRIKSNAYLTDHPQIRMNRFVSNIDTTSNNNRNTRIEVSDEKQDAGNNDRSKMMSANSESVIEVQRSQSEAGGNPAMREAIQRLVFRFPVPVNGVFKLNCPKNSITITNGFAEFEIYIRKYANKYINNRGKENSNNNNNNNRVPMLSLSR